MSVKIIIDDAKGLYQQGATSGGVVGIKQTRSASGVAAGGNDSIVSGAITIPANSVITGYHAVITSQLDFAAAADVGIRFGNSSAGTDATYLELVANSLCDADDDALDSLPVGFGNSTSSSVSAGLDRLAGDTNTPLTMKAGAQKIGTSDVDIYGALVSSSNIDAGGAVQFIVEFITFS